LAVKFRLIHLIVAMTVYLLVWHCTRTRFTVLVSCNDEIAVRSYPFLCLQRQVAKLASVFQPFCCSGTFHKCLRCSWNPGKGFHNTKGATSQSNW